MYELKKMERYLRVNLLRPGPRLMKNEFTGPRSHKGSRNTGLQYQICNSLSLLGLSITSDDIATGLDTHSFLVHILLKPLGHYTSQLGL